MKNKHYFSSLLILMMIFSACIGTSGSASGGRTVSGGLHTDNPDLTVFSPALPIEVQREIDLRAFFQALDELAELERAGSWIQGMAIAESGIREKNGDYAGAVAAAFKELSLAYGLGLIQKHEVELGLKNILAVKTEAEIITTASALLAFMNGQWDDAASGLSLFFGELDEPDSFGRWLLLVCALEKDSENRRAETAYRSIRARYTQFPEYWYRGAKNFSGIIAAEFAENCINSSPNGPFANECRRILASFTGLKPEDASSIRTKREIEAIISLSVNSGNPQILDTLLPLIALPENPYTVFAIGELRSLASISGYRDYFNKRAAASTGRLGERLSFIGRG